MKKPVDKQERLSALIGQVYDAALDEALWTALAPKIAQSFGSSSAAVLIQSKSKGKPQFLSRTSNLTAPLMAEYEAYYWQHDVWASRAAELGMSRVFASKDLVSDASLERTEFCQDWLRRTGNFYLLGSVFPIAGDDIAVLGIHRERALGGYRENDKGPVAMFLAHLRRALQIRRQLAASSIERSASLDALERTGIATIVVGCGGQILYANRRAESILREGDAIHAIGGRLAVRGQSVNGRLACLIDEAVKTASGQGTSAGGALSVEREDRLPITMLVAPFRPARNALGASSPSAIVFIRDPEQPMPSSQALRGLFGLTAAEANIAAALGEGLSLDSIAASQHVSLNTARTHLKNILAKTGTRRQAELVALLLRSVASMTST
jgi:DNA-binding CsgD family transcriptional regulator